MAQDTLTTILESLSNALKADGISPTELNAQSGFYQLGLSSLRLTELADQLNELLADMVEVTDFFDFDSVGALAQEIDRRISELEEA